MRPSIRPAWLLAALLLFTSSTPSFPQEGDELSPADLAAVKAAQKQRVDTIAKVYGAVVAIYGNDRAGGGCEGDRPQSSDCPGWSTFRVAIVEQRMPD